MRLPVDKVRSIDAKGFFGLQEDPSQWRIVFLLGAGIYLVTDVFFCAFGSGAVQSWDSAEDNSEF